MKVVLREENLLTRNQILCESYSHNLLRSLKIFALGMFKISSEYFTVLEIGLSQELAFLDFIFTQSSTQLLKK